MYVLLWRRQTAEHEVRGAVRERPTKISKYFREVNRRGTHRMDLPECSLRFAVAKTAPPPGGGYVEFDSSVSEINKRIKRVIRKNYRLDPQSWKLQNTSPKK